MILTHTLVGVVESADGVVAQLLHLVGDVGVDEHEIHHVYAEGAQNYDYEGDYELDCESVPSLVLAVAVVGAIIHLFLLLCQIHKGVFPVVVKSGYAKLNT